VLTYSFPSDWTRLKTDFGRLFRISIADCYDSVLSWVSGRFMVDIVAFDERLHLRHGDYEDAGLSMEGLIAKEYGPDAAELIKQLI